MARFVASVSEARTTESTMSARARKVAADAAALHRTSELSRWPRASTMAAENMATDRMIVRLVTGSWLGQYLAAQTHTATRAALPPVAHHLASAVAVDSMTATPIDDPSRVAARPSSSPSGPSRLTLRRRLPTGTTGSPSTAGLMACAGICVGCFVSPLSDILPSRLPLRRKVDRPSAVAVG